MCELLAIRQDTGWAYIRHNGEVRDIIPMYTRKHWSTSSEKVVENALAMGYQAPDIRGSWEDVRAYLYENLEKQWSNMNWGAAFEAYCRVRRMTPIQVMEADEEEYGGRFVGSLTFIEDQKRQCFEAGCTAVSKDYDGHLQVTSTSKWVEWLEGVGR